jgi:CDP-6-deoxy-D-xylo-4-hexulose-3-dehydrase
VAQRKNNFRYLSRRCEKLAGHLVLPDFAAGASPFGFPITFKETGLRSQAQQYLSQKGIGSRLLFAGNITRQPYMKDRRYRVHGELANTDKVLADTLCIVPSCTWRRTPEYAVQHLETFLGKFERILSPIQRKSSN